MKTYHSNTFGLGRIPEAYDVLLNYICEAMARKGLNIALAGEEGKYLIFDNRDDVLYKFDISFSTGGFNCTVLARDGGDPTRSLVSLRSFNVSWTNGAEIREYKEFIRKLPPETPRLDASNVRRNTTHIHRVSSDR